MNKHKIESCYNVNKIANIILFTLNIVKHRRIDPYITAFVLVYVYEFKSSLYVLYESN